MNSSIQMSSDDPTYPPTAPQKRRRYRRLPKTTKQSKLSPRWQVEELINTERKVGIDMPRPCPPTLPQTRDPLSFDYVRPRLTPPRPTKLIFD